MATELLESSGFEVESHQGAMDEDELIRALPGVDVLGIRSTTHMMPRVLESAPDLLAVGAFCIGTNQIATGGAADRGVSVFNAPFSNTRSVVELAIAEIIVMARRLTEKNRALHGGVWDKQATGAQWPALTRSSPPTGPTSTPNWWATWASGLHDGRPVGRLARGGAEEIRALPGAIRLRVLTS